MSLRSFTTHHPEFALGIAFALGALSVIAVLGGLLTLLSSYKSGAASSLASSPLPQASTSDSLPTFFPPKATERIPLDQQLTAICSWHLSHDGKAPSFKDLDSDLTNALADGGYWSLSHYWVDDDHGPGFAIITHVEEIDTSGKPVTGHRWSFDLPSNNGFSIAALLKALVHADPGHYRVLAFVVAKQPFIEKNEEMTPEEVAILNRGPAWLGQGPWINNTVNSEYHLIVYIYEFARKSRSDDPVFLAASDVSPLQHLKSTAFWSDIENFSR